MRLLFIGDIVGKPGRRAVQLLLPELRRDLEIDVVIANVENLAHGKGLTRSTLDEVSSAGVDIGTGGNHTFSKPEATSLYEDPKLNLVRPYNLPNTTVGMGIKTFTVSQKTVTVLNFLGQFGMPFEPTGNPFEIMAALIDRGLPSADAIIVDYHGTATSEKVVMGHFLNGHVTAVVGTHTHIPTADTRILSHGTGYQTDIGMVGLRESSLGVDWHQPLERFLHTTPGAWEIPDHGTVDFNAVLFDIKDGRTTSIERIARQADV